MQYTAEQNCNFVSKNNFNKFTEFQIIFKISL